MMTTHIVTGLFRGKRVMAEKNMMMGKRITDQNKAIAEKECLKLF